MKKNIKIAISLLVFIAMIFSACDLDWDGEITVTGGTKLPNWLSWITWNDYRNNPGIERIKVMSGKNNGVTVSAPPYMVRVTTYNSFIDILTVQCSCVELCNHDHFKNSIDENEIEKLLEKFNQEFFETKNLIVTELTAGVSTMNIRVNNITKNGVINITKTQKKSFSFAEIDLGIPVTLAIEIDSSFITPPSMSVVEKTK